MQNSASPPLLTARQRACWGLVLGAAFVCGCAVGVDVTEEELDEICADPNNRCETGTAGSSVGGVGGSTGGGFGGSSSGGSFNNGGSGQSPSNGGSFGNTGGTGGSLGGSGTGGTGALPLAEGECLATDAIVVLYQDRTMGAASEDEPSMVMRVQNPGGTSFPLSDLAIRYWFTADGTSGFIGTVDYASVNGQNNINGGIVIEFGQEFGSDFAELTFPSLTDTIGPEGVQQVQLRFHATPYSALTQTNDFSFLAGATANEGTPNRNITPYLQNVQVGGCVPIPP